MWSFFEQPWTLLGGAVIVLLGVLTFRSVWFEKRKAWQWLLPIGVAALGLGLDSLVVTDREKIHRVIKTGLKAVENEDCATIATLIAANYQDSYHKSKQRLMSRCRARLTPPAVESIKRLGTEVEISSPQATVTFTMLMRFDQDSYWARSYRQVALVRVQLELRKQPDKSWLIDRAEVLEVDKMPVTWRVAKEPPESCVRPGQGSTLKGILPVAALPFPSKA
jgi:hypothetical protein